MQMQKFISDGVPQKLSRERSGEQLRSLHAAFRFETSSRSAASSFCAKAIRNPHLTRWPEVAAPGIGAEKASTEGGNRPRGRGQDEGQNEGLL